MYMRRAFAYLISARKPGVQKPVSYAGKPQMKYWWTRSHTWNCALKVVRNAEKHGDQEMKTLPPTLPRSNPLENL